MPFQDIDDTAEVEAPRPPSAIEKLLRRVFVEDFGLKLLALGITLVIWLAVTSENKPVTIHTGVQLNLLKPENLEISNDPPKTVDVLLTGSKHKLNNLRLLDLVATVDLHDSHAGERVIRLSPQTVAIELPEGVKIESYTPNSVTVRLEPVVERQIPVEVRLAGKPDDGFEVYGIQSSPNTARVRGPASHLHDLQRVPTETIALDGKKDSFSIQRVAIDFPNQKVDVLDPIVDVNVEIGPKRTERRFDSVSVRSSAGGKVEPATASVTVSGPANVIDTLRSEDMVVVVDSSSGTPRLELPQNIQHRVSLVSIKPSVFH